MPSRNLSSKMLNDLENRLKYAKLEYPSLLEGARSKPNSLSMLFSSSVDLACLNAGLSGDIRLTREAIRVAGQAAAGLFQAATSETLPITIEYEGIGECKISSRPSGSLIAVFNWLRGVFSNLACGQFELALELCDFSLDILKASSTKSADYRHYYAMALKSLMLGSDGCADHLVNAVRSTDPELLDEEQVDWALNLDVPQLKIIYEFLKGGSELPKVFDEAICLHDNYYRKLKGRGAYWERFLSIELTALAVLAHINEMDVGSLGDCVPRDLVFAEE